MRSLGERALLAPAIALAIAAMVVFVLSLALWSRHVDASAREREEALVRDGVRASLAEIEAAILPETRWDEAVVHLDHAFNTAWADENLNDFYALGFDFEHLLVLDAQDRPIYVRHGRTSRPTSEAALPAGTRRVLAELRALETRRRPTRLGAPPPLQVSRFVVEGERVHVLTASLVQPDEGRVTIRGARAPVLLTVLPIEQVSIELLKDRFMLEGLRSGLEEAAKPGEAQVRIDTLGDAPSLTLTWTPHKPGLALLRQSAPVVALVLLAFGGVAVVMVARARRAHLQLVAAQRTQAEFLANMSHEIRTPLNGVCAVAAALERTPLTPAQREMVDLIRTSGVTLERLLSDLLDVSRMETGAVQITPEAFHLADAVRAVATLVSPRAEAKGLPLRIEIDPAAEATVIGDPVRIKQVLSNLATNAVKFTETGQITLRVTADGPNAWRFEIEDTGIGFDPDEKARLFRKFQQGDASVSRQYGGMGLGLSICRELTELMGGQIDADSTPGHGARFWVRLPLAVVQAPANAEQPADAEDQGPLRILVADDHPTNRRVLEVLLSEFDVELVLAENGLEACQAFDARPFDLVFMDMQMPVMDGLTAIRTIREREQRAERRRTPIIMLTANTLPEHQDASLRAGADLHMPKPIDAARLFAVLQEVSPAAA